MPKATLAQRKDERYRCRYKGKEFYGKTPTEAFAKRDEYIDLVKQGLKENAREITVREYSAKWLPTHRSDVKKRTYNTYAHYIDKANDVIGEYSLIDVTPSDIRAVYNIYQGSSQSSIDKMVTLMHSMFESALHDGYTRFNPCDEIDKPKGTSGSHRALTEEEDALILKVEHPLRNAVLIMRYAGLRRGEVLALTSDDIDFKKNIIHITKAISFDGNKPVSGLPKTEYGIRDVPLFTRLKTQINGINGRVVGKEMSETSFVRAWESYINAVEKHINGCQKRWYGRRQIDRERDPEGFEKVANLEKKAKIFQANGRKAKYLETLQEIDKVRLKGWKSFSIRPHDLRHSYVTMLCDANVEKDLAMLWTGHSDDKMINKIYDHVSKYRKEKATTDVEALLENQ